MSKNRKETRKERKRIIEKRREEGKSLVIGVLRAENGWYFYRVVGNDSDR